MLAGRTCLLLRRLLVTPRCYGNVGSMPEDLEKGAEIYVENGFSFNSGSSVAAATPKTCSRRKSRSGIDSRRRVRTRSGSAHVRQVRKPASAECFEADGSW